jgi:curved DNA-binding protein CbpA
LAFKKAVTLTILGKSVEELTRAYRILDTPTSASALAIKSNYRKLIKRWHPDKPATSAATHDEAVMMTKLINEAYTLIENAPLRYYKERTTANFVEIPRSPMAIRRGRRPLSDAQAALIQKRMEYAVRIGSGILSGAAVGFMFGVDRLQNNVEVFTAALACALLFAGGAVRAGDKIWRGIFGIWWRWE